MVRATCAMCVVCVLASVAPAAGQDARAIRSHDPRIAAAVDEGIAQSPTFSRLVHSIDRAGGIIYVDRGDCQRRRLKSCLLLSMTTTQTHRIMFVSIGENTTGADLITAIAHELQHAMEILDNENIRTGAAMYLFYRHQGLFQTRGYFETNAALRITVDVSSELARAKRPIPDDTTLESVNARAPGVN